MGQLIYAPIASLDGYIEDADGNFDWAMPDDEVHSYINDLQRDIGVHLYGRRMYETMMGWETEPALAEASPIYGDFAALWQAADKIVYSGSLQNVSTRRTRIERNFDAQAIRELKANTGQDISIAGPTLAAHAFRAGLIDECHLFLAPVIVGRGKKALPDDTRVALTLLDERRFGNGMVHLRYRLR